MNIKLVLNSDIHKVSTGPSNYQELLDVIARTFKEKLPSNYDIKYKDFEDDMIIIQDDEGFKLAYESFLSEKMNFLKIYIVNTKMQDNSENKSIKSDSKTETKSQINSTVEKKKSEKSFDNLKYEKKFCDQKETLPSFNNSAILFLDDQANKMNIIKNENLEINSPPSEIIGKKGNIVANRMNTPFFEDYSDFEKILTADFKKLTNETPDITTITYENAFKTVNKAFEFLDIPFRDSEPLQKSLVPEKNDINMQLLPPAKEKDMASPLKPLNVFPPLETLKEEESIIEEKSSEYPLNESGNCRNIQILESFSNSKEVLPKKLCIKCCRCSGTGIDPNSPKKGKACSKCVKGFVKVNKKMLKLINHVLTYKLSTKFKKLLELNNEIGKGVISIFDKDIKLKSHENIEKIDELKNQELESFVCQACSGEFGPSEIRYKSIEGDLELCEKCENECFVSQNFIKLKPPSRRQGTNSSSSNNNLKVKNSNPKKSETLSMSTTSETWSNNSTNFGSNKNNEIKAKLIGTPQPITAAPDSRIFQFIEVCNSGNVKWPNNVFLVCVSGEFQDDFKEVPPFLEQGARVEIRLELESPSKVGKYHSAWRLSYIQEGEENFRKFFGPRISFEINVEVNDAKKAWEKLNSDQAMKAPIMPVMQTSKNATMNTSAGFFL